MLLESELRKKEVINMCDGRRLGFLCNMEINEIDGCICAIFVPGPARFFGFLGNGDELMIPWNRIVRIGDDVILVDLDRSFFRKFEAGEK